MTEEDHNEDSAVRKDAPTLFGIAKHAPFVMEAGLFERFPHEVQALAIKQSGTPLSIWLKRVAIALPALALVLFVVHELRAPGSPVAYAPFTDDSLLFATSDPFDTRAILQHLQQGSNSRDGAVLQQVLQILWLL